MVGPVGLEPTTRGLEVALRELRRVPVGVGVGAFVQVRGLDPLIGVPVGVRSCRVVSAGSVEISVEDDGGISLTSGAVAVGPDVSTAACNPLSRPPKVPQGARPSKCFSPGLLNENDVVPKAFAVRRRPLRLLLTRICLRTA